MGQTKKKKKKSAATTRKLYNKKHLNFCKGNPFFFFFFCNFIFLFCFHDSRKLSVHDALVINYAVQ